MDKATNIGTTTSSNISINERKSIAITGVKKIDSFNDEEFLVETALGYMIIKGNNLEIIKLDTYQGNVSIKGIFNSLSYIQEGAKKTKDENIISRLFK
ncbi:MAG: sporulation protein YabP [Bacilli bacterium]|nr:sporulation protein YabP [Bacilli bacterium]